jgi:hypothetical protein
MGVSRLARVVVLSSLVCRARARTALFSLGGVRNFSRVRVVAVRADISFLGYRLCGVFVWNVRVSRTAHEPDLFARFNACASEKLSC